MLFGKTRAKFKSMLVSGSGVAVLGKPGTDAYAGLISGAHLFQPAPTSSASLLEYYNTSPSVRSIVTRVADNVALHKWHIVDADGATDYEHEAVKFLNRGSFRLRGRGARRMTIVHRDLAGESFWVIGRDARGKPATYAPIPPNWVFNVPTGSEEPDRAFFEVQPLNGTRILIPAANMIWLRDPDPLNPFGRGKGLTGSATMAVATDAAAATYLQGFLKNNARPDLIVSGVQDRPLDKDGTSALKATWTERFRGAANAGLPFFTAKEIKVTPLGSSLKDNDITGISKELRQTLREVYGVSPEILGVIESSNRATIDAAAHHFAMYTIDPRLSWLLDEIEPFIRAEFKLPDGCSLGYDSPIDEDKQFILDVVKARPEAFGHNEVRRIAGMSELDRPDFDEPPEAIEPSAADPEADDPPAEDKPKKDEKPAKKGLFVRKDLDAAGIVTVSKAHESPEVRASIAEIVKAVYSAMVVEYGEELLSELSSDVAFAVNAAVAEFIESEVPELLGFVDETTRKELAASLVSGVAESEGVTKLLARVDAVFKAAIDQRAGEIAQTVATKIAGFASLTAARQAGFEQKRWLSTGDTKVRKSHMVLNGQVKNLDEPFQTADGDQAQHPGGFGVAKEDANCRCAIRPVLEGEEPTKSLTADKFEAWHLETLDVMSRKISKALAKVFRQQRAAVKSTLSTVAR